ncbi:MAG: bifunctional enoyl-CoA hydratase/phosphate acetyltransferase [Candidatus Cloacimonetes bacterium]|nr:bifunctional enoyl-CoA hydratase/phosphate acetyltransferase [Candidatus Cloacimonadota bacterium]
MNITRLDHIIELAASKPRKRVVVACGQDKHSICAISEAIDRGIVDATMIGDETCIKQVCQVEGIDPGKFQVVHESDEISSGAIAVDMVNSGDADFIMKGLISSDKYLKALLNKKRGLIDPGSILAHIAVIEVPSYHKLLIISDVAIIPQPDLAQKVQIAKNLIHTAHNIGIDNPKIAVVAPTEKVNPRIESSVHAALLTKMSQRGQIEGGVIDGPLALDLAIDAESCRIKGIKSSVAGDADCILMPNLDAGNVFYKSLTKLGGAESAAVVMGTRKPSLLTSRGDSARSKLYSIALGALMS